MKKSLIYLVLKELQAFTKSSILIKDLPISTLSH